MNDYSQLVQRYKELKQERDELKDKLLVAESNLLNERYACAELSDKLNDAIAQVEVMREALDSLMRLESRGRVMPIGKEWDGARNALSLTTSAALKEIEARTLKEAAKWFDNESYTERDESGAVINFTEDKLRDMAAAKRKEE